jgi:hypothetical protein
MLYTDTYTYIKYIQDVCRIHAIHTDTYTYITVSACICLYVCFYVSDCICMYVHVCVCLHISLALGLKSTNKRQARSSPGAAALNEADKIHSKLQQNAFDIFGDQRHLSLVICDHIYH